MTSRDEELRDLMRDLKGEGTPYIEKPDELGIPLGAACFLNHNRVCGPDCTAFTDPHAPTAQERCTVLTGINAGVELLHELIQLKRPVQKPAVPNIEPPFIRRS